MRFKVNKLWAKSVDDRRKTYLYVNIIDYLQSVCNIAISADFAGCSSVST